MQRLKTRAQFQAVLHGDVVARTPHFMLHRLALACPADRPLAGWPFTGPAFNATTLQQAWVGALLPKRWARRSVTRHALKRQIYHRDEWTCPEFAGHAHVVRLRAAFSTREFVSAWSEPLRFAVRQELALLLARARQQPQAASGQPISAASGRRAP